MLTAAEVFQRSSNIGTVKIARRLGKQRLHDALMRFGFGRRTGIGLEGERPGIVHPVNRWGDIHLATIAFGHGLSVTPLQMVAAIAAIANGGLYMPPRLARKVTKPDGREEPLAPPAGSRGEQRVISPETARTMLSIMSGVTGESGTARQAAVPGYEVAGKTGTAQKVINGKYAAWVASFIGAIPAGDPRLVIGIVIDEPEPEHRGGMVAAPAFRQVAQAALRYLAVPPTEAVSRDEGAAGGTGAAPADDSEAQTAAALAAAAEVGEGPGTDQPVWTEPEDFEDQLPGLGDDDDDDDAKTSGAIEVIGEDEGARGKSSLVQVPSFVGMTVGEAIRAARLAGVELAPEGSGLAVAQSPSPGRRPRGAICRVSFRPGG